MKLFKPPYKRKTNLKKYGNRPMLFYQEGTKSSEYEFGPRLRIFYPSGDTAWMSFYEGPIYKHTWDTDPCWMPWYPDRLKSMNQALKLANSYDKSMGFPKMEFMGYL